MGNLNTFKTRHLQAYAALPGIGTGIENHRKTTRGAH